MITSRLAFLIENLNLPDATGVPDAVWESHQLEFLNCASPLTADLKSRQIGWSFNAAMDAVAHALLVPRSTCIFLSVTQTEANEKIRYANQILDALLPSAALKKVIDNRTEIEFENGSRIVSHPCRPPRGKARARIYPDEIAHYPRDAEIYTALVPIITRGGAIRMGSSPLGASGVFWEIITQSLKAYPGYVRRSIPWWVLEGMCTNVRVSIREASELPTYERVARFGNERLKLIFDNMPLEDFQQEYECYWADESVAWITWDEIRRNQEMAQLEELLFQQAEVVGEYGDFIEEAFEAIDSLAELVHERAVENIFGGGMDIGRRRNKSEIILVGDGGSLFPYRLGITLDRLEFDAQKQVVRRILDTLPVGTFLIDSNGLGMQLAEDLETEYPNIVEGVTFTGETKQEWAVNLKLRMQKRQAPIPLSRTLSYQIHSIKKLVTPSKRVIFDVARNEKHHADLFWALALAHAAVNMPQGIEVGQSVLAGYRG